MQGLESGNIYEDFLEQEQAKNCPAILLLFLIIRIPLLPY